MKKAKTLSDIKNHPWVDEVHREHDGAFGDEDNPNGNYWVYLKPGYQAYHNNQHGIHEPTVKRVCEVLNDATEWPEDPDLPENRITLYRDNRIDQEYTLSYRALIRGFIEAEGKPENTHFKNCSIERGIVLYITMDLNSSPDNVPLTDQEIEKIITEYKNQKS